MIRNPMETDCTRIEMPTAGHTNGFLDTIRSMGFSVEYNEEVDIYQVEYNG